MARLEELGQHIGPVPVPTPVTAVPAGDYEYEADYAGIRALAIVADGAAQLVAPDGTKLGAAFEVLAADLRALHVRECILDGELVAVDERGVPSASRLRERRAPFTYVLFDLLWLDGEDWRPRELTHRRDRLRAVLRDAPAALVLSQVLGSDVSEVRRAVCAAGFRGCIGRLGASPYVGDARAWIAVSCARADETPPRRSPRGQAPAETQPQIAGVRLSHPERVLSPLPATKLELARFYEAIAEHIVPHVAARPLTLLRWAPERQGEKGGVFLRHGKAWGPEVLRRVRIPELQKVGEYLVADDLAGVVGLVQMDILEIHTWNSTTHDLERPDRIVFDLDPDLRVPWADVVTAAHDLRALLRELGLQSWVKTTGGKGLHVVVPLVPESDWATCLAFSRDLAQVLASAQPERFTVALSKARRGGKILVDYLRNNRGNTSVAAFSTRAKPEATVSTPLAWDELEPGLRPGELTMSRVRARLRRQRRDPWAEYWTTRQRLPG